MDVDKIVKMWFEHFAAILDEETLEFSHYERVFDSHVLWYKCPCGGDHVAARLYYEDGYSMTLSPVLNCFINDIQWLVKQKSIEDIIRREEENYFKLLLSSEKTVKKVTKKMGKSPDTMHYLWDTHGIPEEIVEDIWGKE